MVPDGRWEEACSGCGKEELSIIRSATREPEFKGGEFLIVNPHVEAKSGDYVVVKNDDNGEATFKQLKIYGETTVLHPLNPKYPDIELKKSVHYHIVGKIVEKKKRY